MGATKWTKPQLDLINEAHELGFTWAEISQLVDRHRNCVRSAWDYHFSKTGAEVGRRRRNDATADCAKRKGTLWTQAEDDLVLDTLDEDPAEVARVLERTMFAVLTRRVIVRARVSDSAELV